MHNARYAGSVATGQSPRRERATGCERLRIMRRYVGRSEGKRRDSRAVRAGVAGVAAGAMSQPYRLMAEAAESGDCGNFSQVAVVPGRRLPNATKPWRGFLRDGVVEHTTR